MTNGTDAPIWSKSHPAWGMRRRIQRNAYAFKVTMRLTGNRMECPACQGLLDLDTAEVDRAVPARDYVPSNIVYLCRGCNQGRSVLQSTGKDWTRVADYVSDVRNASVGIAIPTEAEARAWHDRRPTTITHPRYA